MKRSVRVLIVANSQDDALVLVRELQRGGFDPDFRRVESADEMTAALDGESWDVVICEPSLPGFAGAGVIQLLQAKQPDLPFIVVSDAIGDENIVRLLNAGATDFVFKNNLARLAPLIEDKLREAESRRARHGVEKAMVFLAALVESAGDAIIGRTLDGIILFWNKGAEQMYGYTAGEMMGRSFSVLDVACAGGEMNSETGTFQRGQLMERCETTRVCKDGRAIEVSLTLSPIKNAAGELVGVSAIEREITARHAAEAERAKLIQELSTALTNRRTLTGLLSICSSCKRIRDDRGDWQRLESYISGRTGVEFTHGICPECSQILYPGYQQRRPPADPPPPSE